MQAVRSTAYSAESTSKGKTSTSRCIKSRSSGKKRKFDGDSSDDLSDAEIRQMLRESHQKATSFSIAREKKYDLSSCSVIDAFIFHFVHTWKNNADRSQRQYLALQQTKDPTGELEQIALEEWQLTQQMLELHQKYFVISQTMAKERHQVKCNLNPGINMTVTRSRKTGKITMKQV